MRLADPITGYCFGSSPGVVRGWNWLVVRTLVASETLDGESAGATLYRSAPNPCAPTTLW